jgi:hypothetical protein
MGNNLAHTSCISGQAECLNCCIQHDVDVTHLNDAGDVSWFNRFNFEFIKFYFLFNWKTPFDVARKNGKYLHMEKGGNFSWKKTDKKTFLEIY